VPPNVLLVIFDAGRRDAFEPYGAPADSTPTVAQLARRGTALPEVYATGCWTAPSHASMFTGLLPRAAGVSRVPSPGAAKAALAAHSERMLPAVLRRAGYTTGAVTANLWCSPASGFDTGFDHFEEVDPGRHARIDKGGRRHRLEWALEGVRGKVDHGARVAGAGLDRWVGTTGDKPFFAFVNLMEAHSPYLPPLPYGGYNLLRRLRVAEEARRFYTLAGICRACAGLVEVPPAALERAAHLYRAGIRYMDDWLGARLERLDELGLLDDTVVIVAADHGENLGENGFIAHALSLDNRLLRVPFVVAGPDEGAPEINSLADLPRYIAGRAGIEEHPWTDGPPAGYGVAQFDPPGTDGDPETIRGFERMGVGANMEPFRTPLTAAVAGDLKLLRRGDREELYDLAADPLEQRPLSPGDAGPEHEAAVAGLRAALEHPAVATVAGQSSAAPPPEASEQEMQDLEERMRLLGYM
jgi:arylsulfatase A-like enzyme